MSALNQTAPRFRSPLTTTVNIPSLTFADYDYDYAPRPTSSSSENHHYYNDNEYHQYQQQQQHNQPPPLFLSSTQLHRRNNMRYAGVDHTLGPTFSDEEDGDDSDFIAAKMASLGLESRSTSIYSKIAAFSAPTSQEQQQQQLLAAAEQQRRIQMQQLAQLQIAHQQRQQTAALQNLLLQSNDPQELREAMALLELQRAQQAATTPATHLERPHTQSHNLAQRAAFNAQFQPGYQRATVAQTQALAIQAQHAAVHGHRQALAAQLEAGALRRERERARPLTPDDAEIRAAFESAPNVSVSSGYYKSPSPPLVSAAGVGWTSSGRATQGPWSPSTQESPGSYPVRTTPTQSQVQIQPRSSFHVPQHAPSQFSQTQASGHNQTQSQPPMGRFARARQELAAAQAASPGISPLAALLARRHQTDEDSVSTSSVLSDPHPSTAETTPPLSESSHDKFEDNAVHLGWGRPSTSISRSTTAPASQAPVIDLTPRTASMGSTGSTGSICSVLRQPYGPPGSVDELGSKNFASRIRRKAGLNLGMLNRRTEIA